MNELKPNISIKSYADRVQTIRDIEALCERVERGDKADLNKASSKLLALVNQCNEEDKAIDRGAIINSEVRKAFEFHKKELTRLKGKVHDLSANSTHKWVRLAASTTLAVVGIAIMGLIGSYVFSSQPTPIPPNPPGPPPAPVPAPIPPNPPGPPAPVPAPPSLNHNCFAPTFQNIDSSVLERFSENHSVSRRKDFFGLVEKFPPPLIGKSDFIPKIMVEHLMRHKKNSALGIKYDLGDQITNMEGALHTFVTPICSILITGDYQWLGSRGGLQGHPFGNNHVRKVILSAAIHPDFEYDTVVMPLVKIKDQAIVGETLDMDEIPSAILKKDGGFRAGYEEKLLKHMVYHLSPTHRLPALNEISSDQIMNKVETQTYLEELIQNPQSGPNLQEKFMRIGKSIISLELLYQIYVHQVRNEFKILNANLLQGYVYTISPPSIFAGTIGGAVILNRLQALAFRSLAPENLFSNLRILGFSDYADKTMIPLFQKALPTIKILSKAALFDKNGNYKGPQGLPLVLHNNGDAFGQNIETEGPSSMDGVIGSFSNAASILKRDRGDLVDFIC